MTGALPPASIETRLNDPGPSSIKRRPTSLLPGEADLVDPRIGRQRLADHLARADDAVGDALRQGRDPVEQPEDRHR